MAFIVVVLRYTATMSDDGFPSALTLLPDEEHPGDMLEILYLRAVPILAVLCGDGEIDEADLSGFVHRMEPLFPLRNVREEVVSVVEETMRLPQDMLPSLVDYLMRVTRPFLDDANALHMGRLVLSLAGNLSEEGWQVLLSYGSSFFLTKEELLREEKAT